MPVPTPPFARAYLAFAVFAILASGRVAATTPIVDPLAAPRATLMAAHDVLFKKLDLAKANSDDAYDIVTRIARATNDLDSEQAKADPQYVRDTTIGADLDAAWVTAVTSGTCLRPATAGASETCFHASSDDTLQPLAVYVPPGIALDAPTPVVVLLRGRGETETDLIAHADIRALADESHAIVVVPYARGIATYDAKATADVVDALGVAAHFATLDPKHTYLAGISMGGIAAFHVAAFAPTKFDAMLSIVGTLDPADRVTIRAFDKPIYVVNAEHDTLVSPEHGRETVAYLRATGHAARYYEQKDGTHALRSILPTLREAWRDMFAGVVTPVEAAPAPTSLPTLRPMGMPTAIPLQGRPT